MFKKYLIVFFVSMVPLIELRGAIPIAAGMGLPFIQYYIIAIIGNMIPVPFIYFFARKILVWGADKPVVGNFFTWCLEKGEKGGKKLQATAGKGLFVALLLFVGIPLPGTGAWTGTLAASILDMNFKSSVLAVMLGVILFLAVIVGATYGISRLVVRQPITFKKVLSDFVLINSVSVAVLLIALILMFANSFSFGGALFMLSILLIVVSGVYMIAKYSANHHTRFSSFYGVIIYIIVFFLFVTIFGESLFNQIFGNLISEFNNLFDGSSIY